MPRKRLYYVYPASCTGCRVCEVVCSLIHENTGVNPQTSRIRVQDDPTKGIMIPAVCRLCQKASCITACPESALEQNPETGVIMVNELNCNGCGKCVEACNFGSMFLHPTKKIAIVCDLCKGDPRCVRYCMNGTLVFLTPDKYREVKTEALRKKRGLRWPTQTKGGRSI